MGVMMSVQEIGRRDDICYHMVIQSPMIKPELITGSLTQSFPLENSWNEMRLKQAMNSGM